MDFRIIYSYKIDISAEEHGNFVKLSNQTNLLQSSNWAKIKDNWDSERTGLYKDDALVTSASVLVIALPLGFTMLYVPRGPIMDYGDKEFVVFIISSLKRYGKTRRSPFIKIDPALLLKQYKIGEEVDENKDTLAAIDNLKAADCEWAGRTTTIAESIQPHFQANVYTQEDMTATFPKHTRRLTRGAIHRGVITSRNTIDDVKAFVDVIALTENREGVAFRNENYFRKVMETYGDDAYLHPAKANLPKRLTEYKRQLAQIEKDLSETAKHQKKRLTKLTQQKNSVTKYITEFEESIEKYPDELIIAGILSVSFSNVMGVLYAGMNGEFKKFYPQHSLYPKVFEDAYASDIIWTNMGEVEGTLNDGLAKFKSNFNPTIGKFIGEFNIPVSPFLYKLSNLAYNIRKQRRNSH